ncbi:MAG: hypothetical protein MJ135_06955 [Oscillospiraceae bacterium]|nr:hypothetical protein [Oscillospiraceae bacterium]
MTTSEMTPADIRACTGGGDEGYGFGGGGVWWLLVLFLFAFANGGWGGNGIGGGGSVKDAYVLSSDFATIQRQLSDGFNSIDNALDRQNAGICDLGYTQAQLINGVNTTVMQTGYGIQNSVQGIGAQMAQCCCDIREGIAGVNYNMATQANGLSREVERGFCDTQYRDAMNTNALLQSGHADADRIIAKLDAMEMSRKDEKIAEQNQMIFNLQLKASQEAQNNYLISQLGYQCPKPAYVVQPPQQVTFPTNCCGGVNYAAFSSGCGCGA